MPKRPDCVVFDASPIHEALCVAFENAGITPWSNVINSIVDNVISAMVNDCRYQGERRLEEYLIRKGFDKSYETVEFTRNIHDLVDRDYIMQFRLLYSSLGYRYDPSSHALMILGYESRVRPAVSMARPYPDEGDELDENYIPEKIRRLLQELKRVND